MTSSKTHTDKQKFFADFSVGCLLFLVFSFYNGRDAAFEILCENIGFLTISLFYMQTFEMLQIIENSIICTMYYVMCIILYVTYIYVHICSHIYLFMYILSAHIGYKVINGSF